MSSARTPSVRLGRVAVSALLALATLTAPVQATTFAALSLEQQAKKADVIVQATIGAPTTVTEAGRTYAVYPLKVSETLAGDAAMLPQIGGTQGGGSPALYVLSGMERGPNFQSGQEAVLLLYKGRLDSPLVGFNQGAYLVSGGLVSVLFAPEANPAAQSAATPAAVITSPEPQTTTPPAQSPVVGAPAATESAATTAPPAGTPGQTPVGQPAGSQGAGTQAVGTQTAAGQTSAAQAPLLPPPVIQGPPLPVTTMASAGVLGKIRTPAELKAAIVAARAAK